MRRLQDDVVLVTDATSDLGRALVRAAVRAGCRRIYACAPRVLPWTLAQVVPAVLDSASDPSARQLADVARDVTVVISTASSSDWPPVAVGSGDVARLTEHFDSTVIATVRVASAFAPALARCGGVIACVESVQAWVNLTGAYAVAQSALWSAVNALRIELRDAGVHVMAAVGGLAEAPRPSADQAADRIISGIRDETNEIVLDEYTADVRARLSGPIEEIYPELG